MNLLIKRILLHQHVHVMQINIVERDEYGRAAAVMGAQWIKTLKGLSHYERSQIRTMHAPCHAKPKYQCM